jgi:sialate O-acetylesterase
MKRLVAALVLVVVGTLSAQADVALPRVFSDHMVLQRELPVPVWGTGSVGEKVTVKIGDAEAAAEAGGTGRWLAKLPTLKASSTPQELVVRGKNTVTIKDVLVGDVWLASGQSNMEMSLGGCNAPQDVADATFPAIRRIRLSHVALARPGTQVSGQWEVCTPASAPGFTAVGLYFARRIQKETDLPIGLIDNSWGGTRIEPWIPPAGFEMQPSLRHTLADVQKWEQDYRKGLGQRLDALEKWIADTRRALAAGTDLPPTPTIPENPLANPGNPMSIYNGMVHPLVPFAIKGALWYQGESNGGEGDEYYHKMRALIGGWRRIWNQGEFPVYFVQLANWLQPSNDPAGGDGWARVRMAQLKSLEIPHTGMAVIIDIGEANDIHPRNKFDVGERLALWALRHEYGKNDLVVSGPLYKSAEIVGNKIRVHFDHVGSGLMVGRKDGRNPTVADLGGKLRRFAIAGEDKKWFWADAVIEGDSVVVSSPDVPKPVAVRYAFTMNPEGCNLYNKEGLPASPFRTDAW